MENRPRKFTIWEFGPNKMNGIQIRFCHNSIIVLKNIYKHKQHNKLFIVYI